MGLIVYYISSLFTLVAGLATMAGLGSLWRRRETGKKTSSVPGPGPGSSATTFFGSQLGGGSTINYSYT